MQCIYKSRIIPLVAGIRVCVVRLHRMHPKPLRLLTQIETTLQIKFKGTLLANYGESSLTNQVFSLSVTCHLRNIASLNVAVDRVFNLDKLSVNLQRNKIK